MIHPLTGDIVITVDAEKSKLLLDLPEAFVKKRDVDIHPLVRKLQGVKKNSAIFALAASSPTFARSEHGRSRPVDTSLHVAREYEDGVKKLFVQHIKEFAAQLVTLGDTPETKTAGASESANLEPVTMEHFSYPFDAIEHDVVDAPT
ncbi:Regulator of chromosome condensation (RCC1)-like protein [Phytophthora palmivora]|uniref:Regulator of chromosome condensation (RCC1)-like protein n=1 Tax=Phytophthora palmivora TaxID=4796 RepID=A0A2P4XM90_9STRA|nr:Regulator of chromosome condensation (RCC1)-like protein [Phytophthora palmivora]